MSLELMLAGQKLHLPEVRLLQDAMKLLLYLSFLDRDLMYVPLLLPH